MHYLTITRRTTSIRVQALVAIFIGLNIIASKDFEHPLWLKIVNICQESVPEEERGVVVGVQNTMQSFCYLLIFIVAMIIPHPQVILNNV